MIVYLANNSKFRDDILSSRIEEIVHDSFRGALGKSVEAGDLASWKNSLRHMDTVLEDAGIPDNAGVAIEFNIPQTVKRVDFIVTGTRGDGQRTAVIVERKQWQETTTKDAMSRRIPNSSRCVFRQPSDGSRNGKVVVVQSRDIQDPDTGGQFTVKIYRSEKITTEDSWLHRRIRLEPDSSVLFAHAVSLPKQPIS